MTYRKLNIALVSFLSMILIMLSCVEPITPSLNEDDAEPVLVVDSKITDEEGPFKVKLTTSVPVNVMYYPEPLLEADVRISDDHGNVYQLVGDKYGKYETAEKNLKGVPGYSYSLHITTRDGMQYKSDTVTMQDVPDIDNIYSEEVVRTSFEEGQANDETWLNILLDTHDPQGTVKYWYFEFEETWEVKLLTDDILVDHTPSGTVQYSSREKISVNDEKVTCWVTMSSSSIRVTSTVSSPVDEIKGFQLQSLGPAEDKLHIGYSILAKQSSISREQYDYWKQLMDANEDVGGIYDKIPSRVIGNITSSDGKIHALGNFSALSVKKKRLFIDKYDHHVETVSAYGNCSYYDFAQVPWVPKYLLGTIEGTETPVYCNSSFCADCRDYGTNIKPDFWE
jgi:hypothetical protein